MFFYEKERERKKESNIRKTWEITTNMHAFSILNLTYQ